MEEQSFEIILGTYEEYVLGYKFSSQQIKPTQSFASHSHTSSVRCIGHQGKLLATGGADDRIILYDMKLRKELCILDHHSGTINSLKFTDNCSHLISGAADGILAIVRVGSWMLEKVWEKAHKGTPIIDIAVHPTGKLALTLGSDLTLNTWNLIKGRKAFAVNLNSKSSDAKSLTTVKFAPDGVHFVLAGGMYTEIWSIDIGGIVTSIEHEQKVVCCEWSDDDKLITGYENGKIAIVDTKSKAIHVIDGHTSRVKSIVKHGHFHVSSCSNGQVKIWNQDFEEISKIETGCRITSCCILSDADVKGHNSGKKSIELSKKLKQTEDKFKKHIAEDSIKRPTHKTDSKCENKKKKRKSVNDWTVEEIAT